MQADLFLEAGALRNGASILRNQRDEASALATTLQAELEHAATAGPAQAPQGAGDAVEQVAKVLAALARSGENEVTWNSVRFPPAPGRPSAATAPRVAGGTSLRDVAGLFTPLARSPGVLAAHLAAQGEYRRVEGLALEIARLRELSVVVGDLDLEGHRVSLGLTVLARAR